MDEDDERMPFASLLFIIASCGVGLATAIFAVFKMVSTWLELNW